MDISTKNLKPLHSRDETLPHKTGTLVQRLPCSGKVHKTNQCHFPFSSRKVGFRLWNWELIQGNIARESMLPGSHNPGTYVSWVSGDSRVVVLDCPNAENP